MLLKDFKRKRICGGIEKYQLDLLIMSSPSAIFYMSDYFPIVPSFLNSSEAYSLFDPISQKIYFVCASSDCANVAEASVFDKVFTFGDFYFNTQDGQQVASLVKSYLDNYYPTAADALEAAIKELCPHAKRIGIEENQAKATTWLTLKHRLSDVELIPAEYIIKDIRSIKHPDEQAEIIRSTRIAEESYWAVLTNMRPGVSEEDLVHRYCGSLAEKGADPYFCVIVFDQRSANVDSLPKSWSILRPGSIARFDFGCIYHHYRSDLGRCAVMGHNPKAEDYYKWLADGVEAGKEAARPGVTAGEIFDIMQKQVRKGIPDFTRFHCGHGIGVAMYDDPQIVPGSDRVLEENMIICLETPYYEVGWGGMMVEETVLIQADGAHYITSGRHELPLIGL